MFSASGITEKLESHYFYKLLKLRKKELRYKHHHDFLTACRRDDVIPTGLKLHKTPNIKKIAKLKDMERFPDGAILVTIEVVGLYPNIPHDEG